MNQALVGEREEIEDEVRMHSDRTHAVFLAKRNGALVYANEAACALSGYTQEALLEQPVHRLLVLTWPDEQDEGVNPAWPRGRFAAVPTWLRRADGSWIRVEASAQLLPGGKVKIWAQGLPAQPTVQADGAPAATPLELGVSGPLLQSIFNLLPVGIWLADRTGRIIGNNPAAIRIWGDDCHLGRRDCGEYNGWWAETGQPIAAEEWGMARAIGKGETSTGELIRIQRFDGSFRTIIHSAAPLRDGRGEIMGAIAVNEDITQLHEAQEKQRDSEALMRTAFDLMPVGLRIADRDGLVVFANPAAEHMWIGDPSAATAHDNATPKAWWSDTGEPIADDEWALARALRGETSRSELIRIQCLDGSTRTMMNWATPIRSPGGEIVGAIAANQDVTGLHYTQEQLRVAVQERERILAVVAHDLRIPLSAMALRAATAKAMAARLTGGEPLAAQLNSVLDIGRQAAGLVNDLLSIGAAAAGGHPLLQLSDVSAATLLERAVDAVAQAAADKGLALDVQPAADLPPVRADADRILRVLGNLLDNAVKFTQPPGRITLGAASTPAGIVFSVANSGPAIAKEELELMFQPFWQARSDQAGTGLGLSICRSIVEAHGGRIWAEPSEGQRLRICFVLPRT